MNKSQKLEAVLPVLVPLIGKRFGIPFRMVGDDAYTDGTSITIPAIDPVDEGLTRTIIGFMIHEGSHLRCSDFSVLTEIGSDEALRRHLLNALEDIRVECDAISEYRGAAPYLAAVNMWLVAKGDYFVPEVESPGPLLVTFVDRWLRVSLLGEKGLLEQLGTAEARMVEAFSDALLIRLKGLLSAIPERTPTTRHVLLLVDQILAKLEEAQKEAEEQSADASLSEEDQTGASDDGQTSPGGSVSDTDSADEEGPNESGDECASSSGGGIEKASNIRSALEAGEEAFPDDPRDQLEELISKSVKEEKRAHPELDLSVPSPAEGCRGSGNLELGLARHGRVLSTSNQIASRLRGIVQASLHVRTQPSRRGRKIDPRRLVRVSRGDCRIFLQQEEKKRPNTAVHLLLDRSGSMNNGAKLQTALDAVLALAIALEKIQGVSLAVTAFPGPNGGKTVQSLLERGQRVANDLGQFAISSTGNTPLAEAMWNVAAELTHAVERRRVLIVASDGLPNDQAAALQVIDRYQRAGIEVIGLGIETSKIEGLFPVSAVIRDVRELRDALFEIARKTIVPA